MAIANRFVQRMVQLGWLKCWECSTLGMLERALDLLYGFGGLGPFVVIVQGVAA
jgi:hypothetical protein